MIVLAIIGAVMILLAFLRFGVIAEYSHDGFSVTIYAGLLKMRVYPIESGKQRIKKRKLEKPEKPGLFEDFKSMIPVVKSILSQVRRRLLIKELKIYYLAAGENAALTAISFGAVNAVFETVSGILENNFRIKKRDFRANADFTVVKPSIYISAVFSMAVWEMLSIALNILPLILTVVKNSSRKEDMNNGQTPDR